MDTQTLREELHQYIERADEAHLAAIFQIAEKDKSVIDTKRPWLTEEVLQQLEESSIQYHRKEGTWYTAEESIQRLRQSLKK
jgi:hypothetical protein